MGKAQDAKKAVKKEPAKTAKEKKQEKQEKKNRKDYWKTPFCGVFFIKKDGNQENWNRGICCNI